MKKFSIVKAIFGVFFAAVLYISPSQAQGSEETKNTQQAKLEELEKSLIKLQSELEQMKAQSEHEKYLQEEKDAKQLLQNEYAPKVFGTVMATYMTSTYDGHNRFNVRNTRFGVRGKASQRVSYMEQIDFHNQGNITVLDANVKYDDGRFDVALGQQGISISNDYKRGPSTSYVPTLCYTGALGLSFYGNENGVYQFGALGNRDIGVYARYLLDEKSTLRVSGGVFNGSGINVTDWDDCLNYTGRLTIGKESSGWFAGASYYGGCSPLGQDVSLYTGEIKYETKQFFIEGVAMYRDLKVGEDERSHLFTNYLMSFYRIPTPKSNIFDDIAPLLRFDSGLNIRLVDEQGVCNGEDDVYRASAYANCQFKGTRIRSRLSVGYEKVFSQITPMSINHDDLLHDKFVVALTAVF